MQFRRYLVGNRIGRSLEKCRDLCEAVQTVLLRPEQGGTVCQDFCASTLLPRMCRPGAGFLDVGAHIGSVSAAARHYDPSLKIVAVEAAPDKAADLARRLKGVEILNYAVSDKAGEATFYVNKRLPGYSSLLKPERMTNNIVPIQVRVRRLDDILPKHIEFDLMKIDIEGAELPALRGATETIESKRPSIMFESARHPELPSDRDSLALFDWFSARNYLIFVPNRLAHDGPELCRDAFIESHFYPRRTTNYFAIAAERRTEIRDRARRALGIQVQ